ncbi:MAG: hypothetical protein HYZ38_24815 [Mycobacterium sp.]|nr:hypothetical protein [Mycobacterium sp.]
MTDQHPTDVDPQDKSSTDAKINPRDTDHPTGEKQAAENIANDPPG